MARPITQYTSVGDITIAYQVVGDGPIDLVYSQGWLTNIEYAWESPQYADFLTKLSHFSRLIFFDKRGTGLSERDVGFPTLEQRTDDITAVLDAVGSEKASLLGVSEGGNMSAMFAATYPERTNALVLYGSSARGSSASDYPYGFKPESIDDMVAYMHQNWGKPFDLQEAAPSVAENKAASEWWGAYLRHSASPKTAELITRLNAQLDTRDVLPLVDCPTLVINRENDVWHTADEARFVADLIPNSTLKLIPGVDHLPWYGDQDQLISEIQNFLIGHKAAPPTDRVLLTILMTDIVGSTERAATLGDRRWRALLDQHDELVRSRVESHGGRTINTTGDGFITAFTGPTRAINCAESLLYEISSLGMDIRAGIHTGECEQRGSDIGGLAVHIAARVMDSASAGQVLTSSTVKDLTVGSGIEFKPTGTETLKGIPGDWPLFAIAS
jgi:pimeloyl-ACP methyl ester carboxylesterase